VPRPGSSRRRTATPTPLTNRRSRPRVNSDEPSFNDIMSVFLCQLHEDRLIQQEERRERQRISDAQMQMQQTFMNSMMLMMMNSTGVPFANGMMPQLNAVPQLNAMAQAPMVNAAVGHEDGGARRSPMGGAIVRQEVGDTGGDVGLTHAEQRRERNQMRLEAEERRRQRSRELMEEAIRNGLSREEAERMDPEFGI
jgi:hypothetical protein